RRILEQVISIPFLRRSHTGGFLNRKPGRACAHGSRSRTGRRRGIAAYGMIATSNNAWGATPVSERNDDILNGIGRGAGSVSREEQAHWTRGVGGDNQGPGIT